MEQVQLTQRQLRQMEVDAYQANIDIYKALLATLDGNWDEDLIHLKDIEGMEAARQCPIDRLERFAVLQQYEQISKLLKTETVECAKSRAILNILPE
jgi:hypothetical protein